MMAVKVVIRLSGDELISEYLKDSLSVDLIDSSVTYQVLTCPACKGAATSEKAPGAGGCDRCKGEGIVYKRVDKRSEAETEL